MTSLSTETAFILKNINVSKQPTNMFSLTQNDLIYTTTNYQVKIQYELQQITSYWVMVIFRAIQLLEMVLTWVIYYYLLSYKKGKNCILFYFIYKLKFKNGNTNEYCHQIL